MNESSIIASFRKKVCATIEVEKAGLNRYIVYTPFMFDDGDHFVVILRKDENGKWVLADEGHTLMHLSYEGVDIATGTRSRIVDESLLAHGVEQIRGELILGVPDGEFGNALFSYLQALSRTTTVSQMTVDRVASTFAEDFKALIAEIVPENSREFAWNDPVHDPDGNYAVDCRINKNVRPCFVFGINSNEKCSGATISCLMHERFGADFRSIALFEDQASIGRKPLAQLSDVVQKQFSSLGDKSRIREYFAKEILS